MQYFYHVYNGEGPPSVIYGTVGDVWSYESRIWFRDTTQWVLASTDVDALGRPVQDHPIFKSKRRLMGVRWLSQSHWNNLKKRKIENSGTSNLSTPLTHAAIFDSLSKDLMEIMPRNRRKAHLIRLKKWAFLSLII